MPAGIEGFRVAGKAVQEWKEEQAKLGQQGGGGGGEHSHRDHDVGIADRMNTEEL